MSHDAPADANMSAEQRVARLFEAAGYEVAQAVGKESGTVDWYATLRTGFVRPRTYWRVWEQAPADPEAAMLELEQARLVRNADRALAVISSGRPPNGYETDLHGRTSNMVTYRRLALEISGIADAVRDHVRRYEQDYGDVYYLRRVARTREGLRVDAVDHIKEWSQSDRSEDLKVLGGEFSGRSVVIDRARYELGMQFISEPETTRPISSYIDSAVTMEVIRSGFALVIKVPVPVSRKVSGSLLYKEDLNEGAPPSEGAFIELISPSDEAVEQWFYRRIQQGPGYEKLVAARKVGDFRRLSNAPANWDSLWSAIDNLGNASLNLSIVEWLVQLIVRYMAAVLSARSRRVMGRIVAGRAAIDAVDALEDAALEQFALGRSSDPLSLSRLLQRQVMNAAVSTWVTVQSEESESAKTPDGRFSNQLIWDYFLARRIARAFREGDTKLFARYQFSKEYVLLFLAVLAPEVAVQLTVDRGESMRAEIEAEVERRLQLTLGHLVKRSVGAIRMHLDAIRETINPEDTAKLRYELGRIEEELAFQSALAERTGRWQEVPNGPEERVVLHEIVSSVVAPLVQKHAEVASSVDIDVAIGVRARPSVLREILHCLIENAFQAVAFSKPPNPEVRIVARVEGDTILVEVIDSGLGVRPADHERVFEPYFTTKKGGDQPLGTGMGLSIARRYATRIGAVVGLDPERRPTCFFIRLVGWNDPR